MLRSAIISLPILLAVIFRHRLLYSITEDRAIVRTGIIAKNTKELKIEHIISIQVNQNPIERLFGIGTVRLMSDGECESHVAFKGVRDPEGIRDKITTIQ
ncbi:MAG: PH domain-containing protein [Nitrospirae bacterium]|nr:PH domain-containing protein [Nitrospirota bacterium]